MSGDTGVLFYLHRVNPNSRLILFLLWSGISAPELYAVNDRALRGGWHQTNVRKRNGKLFLKQQFHLEYGLKLV